MTCLQDPVFIVCPPRSGSTLLFRTLAISCDLRTVWTDNHQIIEGIPGLHPADRNWESNHLTAADATPKVSAILKDRYLRAIKDRNGRPVSIGQRSIRLLDKNPKNSLRVRFLSCVFPDARFVYLYRDPVDVVSSMLDAWPSNRFVTYAQLPEWTGLPWTFLLVPGWRRLDGLPLPEIVARQWATTMELLLDDLQSLPDDRWLTTRFDTFLSDPETQINRLCALLGLDRDQPIEGPLPLSASTLTPPTPGKWKRNATALRGVWPMIADTADRAARTAGLPDNPVPPHTTTGVTIRSPGDGDPELPRRAQQQTGLNRRLPTSELNARKTGEEALKQDLSLQASQGCSQTMVRSHAKGQRSIVSPVDVKAVRVVEP